MGINLKNDDDKIKTILDYYVLTTKLKDVVRSGWKAWGVKRERVESVAEHIYGTCMLAVAIWSETLPEVNISEVIMMLALHETEEIIIGDITPFDNESKQKIKKDGQKAVQAIFKDLVAKEAYFKLIQDFDARSTPEAIFAHKCDKLESDLMARLYSDEGCLKLENGIAIKDTKAIKELKLKAKSEDVGNLFCVHNRKYFENTDDLFLKINKYLEKNKLIKSKKATK